MKIIYKEERLREKDIAAYLIANKIPFYEKLGMKKSTEVMAFSRIDWTYWTVE